MDVFINYVTASVINRFYADVHGVVCSRVHFFNFSIYSNISPKIYTVIIFEITNTNRFAAKGELYMLNQDYRFTSFQGYTQFNLS